MTECVSVGNHFLYGYNARAFHDMHLIFVRSGAAFLFPGKWYGIVSDWEVATQSSS